MGRSKEKKDLSRKRRHVRVRKKVAGTPDRPRLIVFRSTKHIYGQLVDDTRGVTLLGIASLSPDVMANLKEEKGKIAQSKLFGKYLASKAIQAGFKRVVFDRGGYKYHGRVKAFADGAREGGLEF
ncbi:MAG: 50S ribosomal protein L18 [Candidatus Glassbacteria bacterium RBG_16_58_8]|uniref:Large ribosomal subunit protein uL18 n=1 Tax=Candidatus Glassbacteria bacterium RBG_16_58_8 TaxID=1817866 RepID=A0A1F5YAG1_9BACT|nr:ribosomal protein L18 [uncultured bacterium]OGF97049.1 MAG: 50S ribosomal protein L18 [Candidatus Glassbacteria bacterium RBG_16_58_8]